MEYLNNDFISYEVKVIGYEKTLIHFELKRQLESQDFKNIHPPNPVKINSLKIVVHRGRALMKQGVSWIRIQKKLK